MPAHRWRALSRQGVDMPVTVALRVLIQSTDERDEAADRIEAVVRRAIYREFDPGLCYVERDLPKH